VAPISPGSTDALISLAVPLASVPARELLLVGTASESDRLPTLSRDLEGRRVRLRQAGVAARAAAFTSITPGSDLARLVLEHDVDLVLVDAPGNLLEDARLLSLLDQASSDVAVAIGATAAGGEQLPAGPVLVPFGGGPHDWAAVELGAWLARNTGTILRLAGATEGPAGRDASRLLASASLAVQHALGVPAEPLLVEPNPQALVDAAANAAIVTVGLTERWRREGLGPARTALATRASGITLVVRRGIRPGGLAPQSSNTRFTWTLAGV
jgi:hypothetical protein